MKKILLIMLLFMPFFINAECDRELHKSYITYANDISYDTEYSLGKERFTVTLYNVIDEMKVVYNNKNYTAVNNEVVIDNIKQGTRMDIRVFAEDGCNESVRTIVINQPYYNAFYGSSLCNDYVNKITYCTHKFTNTEVTEKLIKTAIENYEHEMVPVEKEPEEEPPLTNFQKISKFATKWGVRILLVLVSAFLTNWYFNDKYIKIKHKL